MTPPTESPEITELTAHRQPSPEQLRTVEAILDAAATADGVRPLDEQATLGLHSDAPALRLLAERGGAPAGYAQLSALGDQTQAPAWTADLVVHPDHRGLGVGNALLTRLLAAAPGSVNIWAHGQHPAAARLAVKHGLTAVRELWRMRRPLGDTAPLPRIGELGGVRIRPFRPDIDDESVVAVNAAAFASHPEQGSLSLADLRVRMAQPWFDPEGLFVAVDDSGKIIGFHWTKVHEPPVRGEDPTAPIGEIYVLGVDPAAPVRGLGSALAVAGLSHLAARGLPAAMLYAEADNAKAIHLYEKLGFVHSDTDVMYARTP